MKAEPQASASPPRGAPVYRRAASNPRVVRELVFDKLPPAVRDRLTHGIVHSAPEPLLAAPAGRAPVVMRALLGVTLVAAAAVPVLALRDIGDARGAFQPASFAGVYAALFAVVAVAGAAVVRLRSFLRGAPFRLGRYLFPLDLVEASGGRLRVTSLDTLRGAEARPGEVAVTFEDGHAVVFRAPRRGEAPEAIARRVNRALKSARALAYPADEARLALLDPFFEVRVTEDWDAAADTGDRGRSRSRFVGGALAAIVAAVPAGYGVLQARNAFRDDILFEDARDRGFDGRMSTTKLEGYVLHGRRHVDEAASLLVDAVSDDPTVLRGYLRRGPPLAPLADAALFAAAKHDATELARYLRRGGSHTDDADEALFAIARRIDTVASYDTYLDGGGKLHADEVRKGLLPDADFAQAKGSTLVGSLLSFVRRNPGSRHEDEAWQLIRARYADALPAFAATQHPTPEGRRFVEALLSTLQDRADPRVTLDILVGEPTTVAQADLALGARYGDRYLAAAQRFTPDAFMDVSERIRQAVGSWFAGAFPHGVIETARPASEDEGRPRIEILIRAVAYGSGEWRLPGADSSEPSHVTPLVGFIVEVRGAVATRDAKEEITWKTTIADTSDGKMAATRFDGTPRARGAMLEDAFDHFLDTVPASVAASFADKL